MKVLFATSEALPFVKTGGLADVAYALPKEMAKQGVDVRVVLPFYTQIPEEYKQQVEEIARFRFQLGFKNVYCGIKTLELEGIRYYFIDNLEYFDRPTLYGQWDDGERFAYFSTAIIEMLEMIDWIPDVIHANDWHTAMVPVLLVDRYHWKDRLRHIHKVLTIHNIRFQGIFPHSILKDVFGTGDNIFHEEGVKYYDNVNFLKGGINFSDVVTTVSPTYAREIMTPEFGEGLDGVLRYNGWKVQGIINGIDYDLNNPQTDPLIEHHFSKKDLTGKAKNKKALQERLGLPIDPNVMMIGVVSRLTDQKGFNLVQERMEELLQAHVQVVVLGTGEQQYENSFNYFQHRYPDKMRSLMLFDLALAQQIYASCDAFLMPSAFEPCGLSQMMAMHYGTLPIVHETGGLADTVEPYNWYTKEGTGFSFNGFNSSTMIDTVYHAMHIYYNDPKSWRQLMEQAMERDFSWKQPAKDYQNIYHHLLNQ